MSSIYDYQLADTISENLKHRMAELDISQNELARKSGVSRGALSAYTNSLAIPSSSAIKRLADVLECSVDQLLN